MQQQGLRGMQPLLHSLDDRAALALGTRGAAGLRAEVTLPDRRVPDLTRTDPSTSANIAPVFPLLVLKMKFEFEHFMVVRII